MALEWWAITLCVVLPCIFCCWCCRACYKRGKEIAEEEERKKRNQISSNAVVVQTPNRTAVGRSATGTSLTQVHQGLAVGVQRRRVRLTLVLDKSGSMSGSSWNRVVEGVKAIFKVLHPQDTVTCIVFNNEVEALCVLDEVRSTGLIRQLERVNCTGSTAMYDAVSMATMINLRQLLADAEASARAGVAMDVHMVVVLTDGEDNASKTKANEVTGVLHKLHKTLGNCQTIFLGAGLSGSGERILRGIVTGVGDSDCKFFAINQYDIVDTFTQISVTLERFARVDQAVLTEEGLAIRRADVTSSGVRLQQALIRR